MGGMGGTYNLMGDGSDTGAAASTPVSPDGLTGSRGALAANPTGAGPSEADFANWLASVQQTAQGLPTATATNAGSPLVSNPMELASPPGFQHAAYPTAEPVVGHLGAPKPEPPPVVATPAEYAAPTSFRPIWDVTAEVNHELGMKYAWNPVQGWQNDPVRAREWLQMVADKGGDWRDATTGKKPGYNYAYNIDPVAGMGQIYWPGDPARPK